MNENENNWNVFWQRQKRSYERRVHNVIPGDVELTFSHSVLDIEGGRVGLRIPNE